MPGLARIIVGTAGHIDHGKTALVRALTGIDTDRLPEEKARGITIELGFAHFTLAGRSVGVVDVPGHERFVRAMVAGATGVDLVVMVIAADEGVMPQTREHLDICDLLGIPRGLVALTKAEAVEADWLALVTDDVRRALKGTFLEDSAVIPCSSPTGAGVDEIAREIGRLAESAGERPAEAPLRLPLDRVFSIKGFGTVVTGSLAGGRLREGDEVVTLPGGATGKIRGLEVHGSARREASAGERAAANLMGPERADLARGEVLVHPGEVEASSIVDVELRLLPICPQPLPTRAQVLFHALTAQATGTVVLLEGVKLEPGGRAVAQIHLDCPIALLPGDRFILRGFRRLAGHGTTIGGGRVVRVRPRKLRRADPAAAAAVARAAVASPSDRVALEVAAAGRDGIDRRELRSRLGESHEGIERALRGLLARREAVTFHRETGAVVSAAALDELTREIGATLDAFHARHPLTSGMDREELRGRLDPRLFAAALGAREAAGAVEIERDLVRRKGFSPQAAESAIDPLTARAAEVYRSAGLAPPWSAELPARLGATAAAATSALEVLIRRGAVVRVKPDLCFDAAALDALRQRLRGHLASAGRITAQEFKEMTGQTRKYAIPLAERFDAEKLTIRVGDVRQLRAPLPAQKSSE